MGEDLIILPGLEGFVYKGPTYLELNEKLKSNPLVYNLIQQNIARRNNPTKEIVSYKDSNGNTLHTTNVSAGVLSPVDPLAELYVAGKVLDPAFKLVERAGEYGMARLGNNWARARILSRNIDNAASKFAYPVYEFLLPTLVYQPTKQSLERTSLAFFERPLSRISLAERMGIPRGERNLVHNWHIANYPGYLLKILMKGSPLEKQLSKTGTISTNSILALANKASNIEKEIINKVLSEKFSGLKVISYNLFKKAVLNELITYLRIPSEEWKTYGALRLGLTRHLKENELAPPPEVILMGHPTPLTDASLPIDESIKFNTITFEAPNKIKTNYLGHYNPNTLGHSRTYTTTEEPEVLHIMESLSDWAQNNVVKKAISLREKYLKIPGKLESRKESLLRLILELKDWETMVLTKKNKAGKDLYDWEIKLILDEFIPALLYKINNHKVIIDGISELEKYLSNNYLLRQLLENLKYAAENGQTKMRYPTSETAAKIEGYAKQNMYKSPEGKIVTSKEALEKSDPNLISDLREDLAELAASLRQLGILPSSNELWVNMESQLRTLESPKIKEGFSSIGLDYPFEHQTILKKYSDFPKLFKKLYKNADVRIITDPKGNTWYEVDVPKNYLNLEWQFKQGGKMNILQFLKNGSGIHIKKENRGKFTDYCGGKVTSECIAKGKRSSNPAIRKRATFADNARHFKHRLGGRVKKHLAFVNGVSILDSNPDAYKYVKKITKALGGEKVSKAEKILDKYKIS